MPEYREPSGCPAGISLGDTTQPERFDRLDDTVRSIYYIRSRHSDMQYQNEPERQQTYAPHSNEQQVDDPYAYQSTYMVPGSPQQQPPYTAAQSQPQQTAPDKNRVAVAIISLLVLVPLMALTMDGIQTNAAVTLFVLLIMMSTIVSINFFYSRGR